MRHEREAQRLVQAVVRDGVVRYVGRVGTGENFVEVEGRDRAAVVETVGKLLTSWLARQDLVELESAMADLRRASRL